jgi:hypothetical protein
LCQKLKQNVELTKVMLSQQNQKVSNRTSQSKK